MPTREERGIIIGKNVRRARESRGWTRAELAEKLGVGESTVSRWELKGNLPHNYTLQKICTLFGLKRQELERSPEEQIGQDGASPQPSQPKRLLYWNVPYQRNSYFTGREEVLTKLYKAFLVQKKGSYPTVRALSGIGGLGKTQTAVEYCYRHLGDYEAIIWVEAENPEVLDANFAELAPLLDRGYRDSTSEDRWNSSRLPHHSTFDRTTVIQRVKEWLREHSSWLLVFDNVDDLDQVVQYFPQYGTGSILLTTRSQTMRHSVTKMVMERMNSEEATQFLFRRSRGIAANEPLPDIPLIEYKAAEALWQVLGGLPLALDQVAAFAEETGCSLRDYLALFQQQPEFLLKQRGEAGEKEYPSSVSTTWQLSFTFIEQNHPQSADLLRFCAFLHPDDIPYELFSHSYFEPYFHISLPSNDCEAVAVPAAFVNAYGYQTGASQRFSIHHLTRPLLKYSLVYCDPDHEVLHIHRLVQMVLRDRMDESTRILWAERVLEAIHAVFPVDAPDTWDACQRYFPHAQSCTQIIEQYGLRSPVAASLLNRVGYHLFKRTVFEQARCLLERALTMRETLLGPDHLDTAETLFNLGMLSYECGQYDASASLLHRTLAVFEKHALSPDDPRLAEVFIYLGFCAHSASRWREAETWHLRALEIHERSGGAWSLTIAASLNALGDHYLLLGRFQEVERLLQRVLAIRSKHLPADAPSLGETFHDIGVFCYSQGRYTEAEPLYQQALAIVEKSLGAEHRMTALVLHSLGQLYRVQERYQDAERYIQRALQLRQQLLGRHSDTAMTMNQLGLVYLSQGRYAESEKVLRQALTIQEEHMGAEHLLTSISIHNLGLLLSRLGQYDEAERYLKRALLIRKQNLDPHHRLLAESLHAIGQIYMRGGRYAEAEPLLRQALATHVVALGQQHPDTLKTSASYKDLEEILERQQREA